jgi:hypothetical protein
MWLEAVNGDHLLTAAEHEGETLGPSPDDSERAAVER